MDRSKTSHDLLHFNAMMSWERGKYKDVLSSRLMGFLLL
jgi:hypothetical protein